MRKIDWNNVQENFGFRRPTPGGYIAAIMDVEDHEDNEYLLIAWDFVDGEFRGANSETNKRFGYWPMRILRSYKESALPFFKSFKTALEKSNPGYKFQEENVYAMSHRYIGVVLGEEEYIKDGVLKTRLGVQDVRSVDAIRNNDYRVPELRKLKRNPLQNTVPDGFVELSNEGKLPWEV